VTGDRARARRDVGLAGDGIAIDVDVGAARIAAAARRGGGWVPRPARPGGVGARGAPGAGAPPPPAVTDANVCIDMCGTRIAIVTATWLPHSRLIARMHAS
jgi:hypothetical protein